MKSTKEWNLEVGNGGAGAAIFHRKSKLLFDLLGTCTSIIWIIAKLKLSRLNTKIKTKINIKNN